MLFVCLCVSDNVENSDWVIELLSDRVTEYPSDQVTKWQEASQTIDRMVYFLFMLCRYIVLAVSPEVF